MLSQTPNRMASALSAFSKQASGAFNTPAPTWPIPFTMSNTSINYWAIPVSTTRRISIPVGTP